LLGGSNSSGTRSSATTTEPPSASRPRHADRTRTGCETPLGGPVREGLAPNHSETLLGGPVREGLAQNHSETLLALV
jgi:hypothetical protein